jgi:hypothetical protein
LFQVLDAAEFVTVHGQLPPWGRPFRNHLQGSGRATPFVIKPHQMLSKSLQGIGAWVQYKSENRNLATVGAGEGAAGIRQAYAFTGRAGHTCGHGIECAAPGRCTRGRGWTSSRGPRDRWQESASYPDDAERRLSGASNATATACSVRSRKAQSVLDCESCKVCRLPWSR